MRKSFWSEKIRTLTLKELAYEPFIRNIASSFNFYVSSQITTIGIIQNSLVLNPSFISSLSKTELISLVKHEIYYCLLKPNR